MKSEYTHEFTVFKPDIKLKWLPRLGTMQLEIELEDQTLKMDVAPLEAPFTERNVTFIFGFWAHWI